MFYSSIENKPLLEETKEPELSPCYEKNGSRMPYRLPIPRINCRKPMFFVNALQLWNNISDNDFVYSTDLKKFKSNYFDCITRKFTPDSFKTGRIF